MSRKSAIEWTHSTWNPVTGCTKVSAGCDHCYAERFSERFRGVEGHPFETGFDLTLRPERLEQPTRWRRPQLIFVNSMSDLFHRDVPVEYIQRVFDTMEGADWHIYQVLTKRSSLMRRFVQARYQGRAAPSHIWLGVSIENDAALTRLRHLKQTNASVRFVSFEPLLGPMGAVDLEDIHWSSPVAKAGRAPVRFRQRGYVNCGISVKPSASPSSSSSGAGARPKRAAIRWMDGSGWSIRKLSTANCMVRGYKPSARLPLTATFSFPILRLTWCQYNDNVGLWTFRPTQFSVESGCR